MIDHLNSTGGLAERREQVIEFEFELALGGLRDVSAFLTAVQDDFEVLFHFQSDLFEDGGVAVRVGGQDVDRQVLLHQLVQEGLLVHFYEGVIVRSVVGGRSQAIIKFNVLVVHFMI